MLNMLLESIFVGFICYIIGTIIFNFTTNKTDKDNKQNIQKPHGIEFVFFVTGVILHIILDHVMLYIFYSIIL